MRTSPESGRQLRIILVSAIGLSALALVLIGYRAIFEWQHAAGLVASRRAVSAAELLVSALSRDMRGAHVSVLQAAERDGLADGPTADLLHPVAGAFTRYPYAEAFFSWHRDTDDGVVFFSRTERRPAWLTTTSVPASYPVATGSDKRVGRTLLDRIAQDTQQGRRLSAFTLRIGGTDYQVVATITYGDRTRERPRSLVGFLVNLQWAREHYFTELAAQVAEIEGADRSVRFAVVDDTGRAVVGTPPTADKGTPLATRLFPVAFFDASAVAVDPPADLSLA